jgi:hypothetical protein
MSGEYDNDPGLPRGVMSERTGSRLTGRLVFGFLLVGFGLLWTLENLGVPGISELLHWWPALLVIYGLVRFTGIDGTRRVVSGVLFMLVGGWMLAREFGLVHISIFRLWPLWMVFVGATLVWRSMRGPGPDEEAVDRTAYPRPFAFMGGNARKVDSQQFVGLEATAVMGGVVADLTGTRPRGHEVVAEVFAWWGGIELIVPEDWRVVTEVMPIMGGVEDATRFAGGEPAATLIVRGLVVMGGVEVKNVKGARGDFRGVRIGVSSAGRSRRREVRVDARGVTITREEGPAVPPTPPADPPPPER